MVKRLLKKYEKEKKKRMKKIDLIKEGVSLYVLESLQRLILEDLKNYMNSLNIDSNKRKSITLIAKHDMNYLIIYFLYSDEIEKNWNRKIAEIYVMDAIYVLKKYNNFSRKYKRKLREFLGV